MTQTASSSLTLDRPPEGDNRGTAPVTQTASPWWQTFFSGLVLEGLRGMHSEAQTREEADFLQQTLAPHGPGEV